MFWCSCGKPGSKALYEYRDDEINGYTNGYTSGYVAGDQSNGQIKRALIDHSYGVNEYEMHPRPYAAEGYAPEGYAPSPAPVAPAYFPPQPPRDETSAVVHKPEPQPMLTK